jgi:hypothetical protein
MRKAILLALGGAIIAVGVPASIYFFTKPGNDPLSDTLKKYGFLPIMPPSNLIEVGSLYYVDAAAKDFKAICRVAQIDVKDVVARSKSWEMQQDLERNGRLAIAGSLAAGSGFKGKADTNYVQKVHSSLTDVMIDEIPLGTNFLIFAKLMEKPECSRVAMQAMSQGGYVCQGQKILQATVKYNLDNQNNVATSAQANGDGVKDILKVTVETQGDQNSAVKKDSAFAGAALNYGVAMNPTCLAPPHSHFQRVLPRTAFDRVVNFLLFNIVEPMLPAKIDPTEVAENAHPA